MYFDLDDHRPDVPRVPGVISRREGVLLSLVVHGGLVLLILFPPVAFSQPKPDPRRVTPQDAVTFVQMTPRVEQPAVAVRPSEPSDRDRASKTRERAADAANSMPLSRGE